MVLEAVDQAHHRAAGDDAPAAPIVLPPHRVPVAGEPPEAAASLDASRGSFAHHAAGTPGHRAGGVLGWISAHTQLVVIAALVVIASVATGMVVTHGARQLDVAPRDGTTPYLAVAPSGPVRPPAKPAPVSGQPEADTAVPAPPPAAPNPTRPTGQPEAAVPAVPPGADGSPEVGRSPEVGEVPPVPEPDDSVTEPPAMPTPPGWWCPAGMKRYFGQCVVRVPRLPTPQFPTPRPPPPPEPDVSGVWPQ
ncbi:MAG: hypothetical protein ACRDT6_19045 [Micromonosporaceae bacterium]